MSEEERDDLITAEDAVEENKDVEEKLEDVEEVEEPEQEEPEVVEDETVEKAKKYGHLSKDEWIAQGRNPDEWKSPEEFNRTGEIIDQLRSLRNDIKKRDREIESLVKYNERISQREYERAKQELEGRLKAAEDDYDAEGIKHYVKEIDRLEQSKQQEQQSKVYEAQQEAQQRFIDRNQHWFNDRNPDLVRRAQEIDNEYKNRGWSLDDIAEIIEVKIAKEFPERILGQPKASRPTMAPSQSSVNKSAKTASSGMSFSKLPQDLKDTYDAIKRATPGEYTKAQFMQRLKEDGEI